jgi:Tfp pilus assembly protein PilF
MSLLLEALKKAEKAKEEAQKRAREGEAGSAGELRLADEAPATPAAEEKRVVTRDELPPITAPLEIQSEDIAAAGSAEPAPQSVPRSEAAARPRADPQAAQRATARKPFEAKVREPNPRLPFYITVGVLGAFAVGTVIYFWIQLRPPQSLYVKDPKPPSGETVVAPVTPAPQAGPRLESTPVGALPGLPVASAPAPEATQPVPAPAARKPPVSAARPRTAETPPRAAPRPRQSAPAAAETALPAKPVRAAVMTTRPQARIHPLVASGYEAYQAGEMERARRNYDAALADEPGNRDALLGLAAVETRAQRFAAAESLYRRLLQIDPRDAHAQAGLLGLRAAQTDPVSAESRLKGLIASDSTESVLYFSLGNQYAQQYRWAEAQQAFAKAAAMDPENADYAYNYAVSLEQTKQPAAALQQYRRALTLGLRRTSSFDPATAQARVQALSR